MLIRRLAGKLVQERGTAKLHTLVGVRMPLHRLAQRLDTEVRLRMVTDSCHDRTRRLNQSITANKYKNSLAIGNNVDARAPNWFARSMLGPRNKYGYTL